MNSDKLLCTFSSLNSLEKTIERIRSIYLIKNNKILVIENVDDTQELYCIYNAVEQLTPGWLSDTILIHRKRNYNVLYTINSLNSLICFLNKGKESKDFKIPWDSFENTILLIKNGELNIISTKLKEIKYDLKKGYSKKCQKSE